MHDNEYLYGKDIEVPEIPADIIMRRIELLSDNLEEILTHSYYTRDGKRANAVIKAIKFYEELQKS